MIDAAQAIGFIAGQGQRGFAVHALFVENAHAAIGGAKRHKVFAGEADAGGGAISHQHTAGHYRKPVVLAQHVAHGCAVVNTGEELVLFAGQGHLMLPGSWQ